jgi:hypothetical protein
MSSLPQFSASIKRGKYFSMKKTIILLLIFLFWFELTAKSKESEWPAELNTAKDAAYLTEIQKQVILELNKVRSNPKRFAEEYMEELQTAFNGKLFSYPGQDPVMSREGISPLIECIKVLMETNSMPILKPEEGLCRSAKDLVTDQQKNGGIGHITRSGLTPQKRIEKYGIWDICSAEDITYGSFEARQIVITLLIDDGVTERSHRKNILNRCFHHVGVDFGKHPNYLTMCVIDYAGEYKIK